ncbi:hypothetical protein J7T55_003281 [Diaporthe amygdali]|uniref:uncharacterized protein n=1 Tax=Phomopsis amygdali TaxID=1214568 RepID=UPI0022FE44D8|nr:uncharacterized protein J7T55_003281 [Diaporthe amygdali]KAJ0122765.1 hypothetical protein J7T55_003281 [Diaporthe amygdali]
MSIAGGRRVLGPLSCLIIIAFFALAARCQQVEPTQKPIVQVSSTGTPINGIPITQKPTAPEPIESIGPKRHSDLPVLGYVTPWNSRGKQLVEDYRQKFDLVSPVWYTVHADEAKVNEVYSVRGGPPAKEDEDWYQRLQKPKPSSDAAKPLQIVPRFILDGWDQDNFQNLIFNETRWQLLSEAIMDVVVEKSFDGVVFESGASYALGPPLTKLSELLHNKDKLLILVMPPVRAPGDGMTDAHNSMILQPLAGLSHYVDYFSIMTYDMSGPGGQELQNKAGFPDGSSISRAIAQGQAREPGPNTSADWVKDNLKAFIEASQAGAMDPSQSPAQSRWASRKFLMGMPLYGYKYPVLFVDKKTGDFVKRPSEDTDSGAVIPVLKGAGEPVIMTEILEMIKEKKAQVLKSEADGEYFFDYEKRPGTGYWRVFLPTTEGISHVFDTIKDVVDDDLEYAFGGAGVALWEVGQSSNGLLASI